MNMLVKTQLVPVIHVITSNLNWILYVIYFFNQKELQCCSSLDENLKPSRQTKQADTSTGQRSKIFILDKIKCGVFSLVSFLISHYLGDNCVLLVWPVGPY